MATKRFRQNAILALVRNRQIDSQQQLAKELAAQGIPVSQSTLSRDIQELGLAKAGNVYTLGQAGRRRQTDQSLRLVLREFLLEVDAVEQMLVFRTSGGGAGPIAEVLDDTAWPEIAGTIAGENTVFALCRSAEAARTIRQRIEELAGTR